MSLYNWNAPGSAFRGFSFMQQSSLLERMEAYGASCIKRTVSERVDIARQRPPVGSNERRSTAQTANGFSTDLLNPTQLRNLEGFFYHPSLGQWS
jgi:hypothetical protein